MTVGDTHLEKARTSLAFARFTLGGGYAEEAGRGAYMAAFHAAMAFIEARTGKHPKTHKGVRIEFTALAKNEAEITADQIRVLGWTYEMKSVADYSLSAEATVEEVEDSIREATGLVDMTERLIGSP